MKQSNHLYWQLGLAVGALYSVSVSAQAIVIDGQFNEPQWQSAVRIDDFYQVVPATLTRHQGKVEVKAFANEQGVYIGYTNHQSRTERKKQYNLQDGFIQADLNRFVIDFAGDGSGAYLFAVSLGGGIQDAVLTPQLSTDYDWDGVWEVANFEADDFWTSEVFIPWTSVSFRPNRDENGHAQVGLSFQLYELATNYIYGSQPQTTGNSDFYLNMPKVSWSIPDKQQVSFIPYITQQYDATSSNDKHNTDVGFDLIYKPNHHQKLSLAVNPDFGQVDSDELNLNYSNVETLLTDKRPFFTQDIGLFNVALQGNTKLIHTRRIGAGSDDGSERITPIDAAVRVIHQGDALNVGAFAVKEDSLDSNAGKSFYAVRGNYRSSGWQSGLLATQTERPWLDRQAQTLAWDSQYQSDTWAFQGALLRSDVDLQNTAQTGNAFFANTKYQFSPNLDVSANYYRIDDQFDNTDLGYLERNNRRMTEILGNYAINVEEDWYSRIKMGMELRYQSNDSGLKLNADQKLFASLLLNNGAQLESSLTYSTAGWNDNIGYSSAAFKQPSNLGSRLMYLSPYTGQFSWAASFQLDREGIDGLARQFAVDTTWMPHPNWTVKFNSYYREGDGWLVANQYNQVSQYDRDFFVNLLNITGLAWQDLEMSFNFQWAVLEARSRDVFAVEANQLISQQHLDTSFEDKRFTAQFKLRYKLGAYSDVYFVYSRAGDLFEQGQGGDAWLSGIQSLWSDPKQDSVILKFRYLL